MIPIASAFMFMAAFILICIDIFTGHDIPHGVVFQANVYGWLMLIYYHVAKDTNA